MFQSLAAIEKYPNKDRHSEAVGLFSQVTPLSKNSWQV